MKRFIALAMALLMLSGVLVSCQTTPDGPNVNITTPPESDTTDPIEPDDVVKVPVVADDVNLPDLGNVVLDIVKNRKTEFKIVYATENYSGAQTEYSTLATKIFADILKSTTCAITQSADANLEASSDAYEILVGPTNREESNTAMMFAKGTDGFVIKAVGKKLVINAFTDDALAKGVDYFLENIIGKVKGINWTFTSANDYCSAPEYKRANSKVAGYSYAPYTIVVPEGAGYAELRTARRVQYAIGSKVGVLPAIVYDNATGHAENFEILIGNTNRTSEASKNVAKLEYVVALNNAKIEINAGSIFAFEAVSRYAEGAMINDLNEAKYNCGELVRVDNKKALEKRGNYVADEKEGEIRMVVHNVWGWNETSAMGVWGANPLNLNGASQRNLSMAELYIDLDADVILLQEYTDRLLRVKDNYDISPILKEAGYGQVYQAAGIAASATPIFYKEDKFELLESNVINLMTKYSGCGGDKYMTIAVLKQKSDGKIFGVISIHKDYRGSTNPTEQLVYDTNRKNMAADAVQQAKVIRAKYNNCPVFVGGDFNCNSSSAAFQVYTAAGYSSAQAVAENTDTGRSYLPGPAWDKERNMFISDHVNADKGSYKDSIDHIVFIGDSVECKRYDILTDVISASIADHMPQVLDFNIN